FQSKPALSPLPLHPLHERHAGDPSIRYGLASKLPRPQRGTRVPLPPRRRGRQLVSDQIWRKSCSILLQGMTRRTAAHWEAALAGAALTSRTACFTTLGSSPSASPSQT